MTAEADIAAQDEANVRAFDAIVGPLLSSLEEVIRDVAELAEERRFAGEWRAQPVAETHQHAGFLLLAAEDHAAGMCRLLRHPAPSIFAHVPMARAALENAALSLWLASRRLDVDARVSRYVTESLFSDAEVAKFSEDMERSRQEKKKLILEQVDAIGLKPLPSKKGEVRAVGEHRPRYTELVTALFKENPEDDVDLGKVLYCLYSAVSHGTAFGLRGSIRAFDQGDARAAGWAPQEGHLIGGVAVDADEVAFVVGAVTHGYLIAAESYVGLMGWEHDDRRRHATNALQLVRRAFDDGRRRRG